MSQRRRGVEVQFHIVLTSVLVGEEWSVLFACRCNHTTRLHGTSRMGNNGTQSRSGGSGEKKNVLAPCWEANPYLSVIPLVIESLCWLLQNICASDENFIGSASGLLPRRRSAIRQKMTHLLPSSWVAYCVSL